MAMEGENEGQEARKINTLVFGVGNWVDGGAELECSRGLAGRKESSVKLEAEVKCCTQIALAR